MTRFSNLYTEHPNGLLEQYWFVYSSRSETPTACSYGYRFADGSIFHCVEKTLEDCRVKRDEWLTHKKTLKLPSRDEALALSK